MKGTSMMKKIMPVMKIHTMMRMKNIGKILIRGKNTMIQMTMIRMKAKSIYMLSTTMKRNIMTTVTLKHSMTVLQVLQEKRLIMGQIIIELTII